MEGGGNLLTLENRLLEILERKWIQMGEGHMRGRGAEWILGMLEVS